MSAAAQWQDFTPGSAQHGDGWQDYDQKKGPVTEEDLPGSTPRLKEAAKKMPASMSTPTQFENERNPKNFKESGIGSFAKDVAGMAANIGVDPTSIAAQGAQIGARTAASDIRRQGEGRSLPYRAAAVAATPLANVEGMEDAAEVGNSKAIIGHASAAVAPVVAGELGARALGTRLPETVRETPSIGKRESLADRAGIQAGRPEPNIDVSNPPEPSSARNIPSKKPLGPPTAEEFRAPIGTPKTPLWKQLGIEPTQTSDMTGGIEETPAPEPKFLRQQAKIEPPNQKPLGNPDMEADGPAARIGRLSDNREDAGIRQAMDEDLTNHGRSAYAEERQRKLGELQEMGIGRPKWQRTAESQAQQILDEAQQKAQAIVESSRQKNTRGIFSKVPQEAKPLPDDLTGLLQKSD